jgi:hypothetical protein
VTLEYYTSVNHWKLVLSILLGFGRLGHEDLLGKLPEQALVSLNSTLINSIGGSYIVEVD